MSLSACSLWGLLVEHLLNHIKEPIICAACFEEFGRGQSDAPSLRAFLRIDVGFTDQGLQIWCQRHDRNICVIDFDGMRPEADFRSLIKKS